MIFDEMLTFWMLQGIVSIMDTGVKAKSWKKIRVRINENHVIYIRYSANGPECASVYLSNTHQFELADRIGIPGTVSAEVVMDTINMWIKDLV